MFTQEQLDAIKFAAKKTKNQGELAVYDFVFNSNAFWTVQQWNILRYCAEECKRQRSGEMSVYDMVNAWTYAFSFETQPGMPDKYQHPNVSKEFIEFIGKLVEPHDNAKGFRNWPVFIGALEKENPEFIRKDLEQLLYLYYDGVLQEYPNLNFGSENKPLWQMKNLVVLSDADWFYYYYETIHPFIDGNGRSGKILYNYLCGTLDNPIMPPNFWGGNP